jgi:DNA-directed RNA polymerase subunit omega
MKVVNADTEPGEAKVVNSRYSIVMATSKRARQIIGGDEPLVNGKDRKALSIAVDELNQGKIRILTDEEEEALKQEMEEAAARMEEAEAEETQEAEENEAE